MLGGEVGGALGGLNLGGRSGRVGKRGRFATNEIEGCGGKRGFGLQNFLVRNRDEAGAFGKTGFEGGGEGGVEAAEADASALLVGKVGGVDCLGFRRGLGQFGLYGTYWAC